MCTFAVSKSTGLVAQLDRVPDYGSEGWGFESLLVHIRFCQEPFFIGPFD